MDEPAASGQRLDRWLCNSRFFKTRGMALDAIRNGRIEVNGVRAKPARLVRPGDVLHIRRPPYVHAVEVRGIAERRVSASLAQQLYEETAASLAARERLRAALAAAGMNAEQHQGKPDKQERRQRERFKRAFD